MQSIWTVLKRTCIPDLFAMILPGPLTPASFAPRIMIKNDTFVGTSQRFILMRSILNRGDKGQRAPTPIPLSTTRMSSLLSFLAHFLPKQSKQWRMIPEVMEGGAATESKERFLQGRWDGGWGVSIWSKGGGGFGGGLKRGELSVERHAHLARGGSSAAKITENTHWESSDRERGLELINLINFSK